jgi:hypothetical protein
MPVEDNKAAVRRFYQEVINSRNLDALDELLVPDGVDHTFGSQSTEQAKQFFGMVYQASEALVTGRSSPSGRAGAGAARREPRRSRRPCHPRATSSGQQRYLADSHGHSERPGCWAQAADLDHLSRPKLHGMQAVIAGSVAFAG